MDTQREFGTQPESIADSSDSAPAEELALEDLPANPEHDGASSGWGPPYMNRNVIGRSGLVGRFLGRKTGCALQFTLAYYSFLPRRYIDSSAAGLETGSGAWDEASSATAAPCQASNSEGDDALCSANSDGDSADIQTAAH